MLFDYNKSGTIYARDIGPVVRSVGLKPSQAEIRSIMADVQQNGTMMKLLLSCLEDSYALLLCPPERLSSIVMSMSVSGSVCLYVFVCLSVCVSVCLSVREDMSRTTCTIFTKFFVHVAFVRGSVLAGKGFSSPLKIHYRPGKGDVSAQRRRSKLSTIALFYMVCVRRTRAHQEMR